MVSPLNTWEEIQPTNTLILTQWDLCWTPDLQNYKIMCLYCLSQYISGHLFINVTQSNLHLFGAEIIMVVAMMFVWYLFKF